jgi:hypothetical protein
MFLRMESGRVFSLHFCETRTLPETPSGKREFLIDGSLVRHDPNLSPHVRDIDKGVAASRCLPASSLAHHSLFSLLGIIEKFRGGFD